jgi:hypothetical protein
MNERYQRNPQHIANSHALCSDTQYIPMKEIGSAINIREVSGNKTPTQKKPLPKPQM